MTTFVTCFFDLGKYQERKQTTKFYLEHGKWLLEQDINLVVFTEPQFVDFFEDYDVTVIPIDFKDLKYYNYLEIMHKTHYPIKSEKDTPEYLILINNKVEFLKKAIIENQYNSTHFAWIDFGIGKLTKPIDNIFTVEEDKIKILCMKYDVSFIKDYSFDNKEYMSKRREFFAGGYLTGSKENMIWFCHEFKKRCEHLFENDIFVTEEQIFDHIVYENRNKFIFYYGSFIDILHNYVIHRSLNIVTCDMIAKYEKNEIDEPFRKIFESLCSGTLINYHIRNLFNILNCGYIYFYYRDREYSVKIAKKIIKLVKYNTDFRELFKKYKIMAKNLSYSGLDLSKVTFQ